MNNDLISRSALKEEFQKLLWATYAIEKITNIIDNAPAIDTTFREVVAYECGQKSVERQQGEWLDEKFVAFHLTCNQCGCHIRRQKNEVFEGEYNYNFCPNCGADMRGEDNE